MADIPEKMLRVLEHEGVVAIATGGKEGPHLVNTWNSYVELTDDGRMVVPVGGMARTEKNLRENPSVLVTLGSREVEGRQGPGTGFLVRGTAAMETGEAELGKLRGRFPWARAALTIRVDSVEQTL